MEQEIIQLQKLVMTRALGTTVLDEAVDGKADAIPDSVSCSDGLATAMGLREEFVVGGDESSSYPLGNSACIMPVSVHQAQSCFKRSALQKDL